jgi:hypothetical protein
MSKKKTFDQEAVKLYNDGKSLNFISKRYNTTIPTMRKYLIKEGIRIRTHQEQCLLDAKSGELNPSYGKEVSKETREKISKGNKLATGGRPSHNKTILPPSEILLAEYEDSNASILSRKYGCSVPTILKRIREYGGTTKTMSDTQKSYKHKKYFDIEEEKLRYYYEVEKLTANAISNIYSCSESLILHKMAEFGINARLLDFTSYGEREVFSFISSICDGWEQKKKVIYPHEVDVFNKELNIAIEYNGLYWHSENNELSPKDKKYHQNKFIKCYEKNIKLITIFENEWQHKQEIVKSILKNICGKSKTIYGRRCKFMEIDSNLTRKFLNDNHIQGSKSGRNFGLIYDDELVYCITFIKPRYNKKYDWEIGRVSSKLGTNVCGGLSKILKHVPITGSIVTYSDLRYGVGRSYEKVGFKFLHRTDPNYFYMDNYEAPLLSRMAFQKHKLNDKLPLFDENLSEWENMKNNGYDRIWDCGNNVYYYEK